MTEEILDESGFGSGISIHNPEKTKECYPSRWLVFRVTDKHGFSTDHVVGWAPYYGDYVSAPIERFEDGVALCKDEVVCYLRPFSLGVNISALNAFSIWCNNQGITEFENVSDLYDILDNEDNNETIS